MAEIGQETVKFSTLVSRTAEESYVSLKELVDKCKTTELSDSEKKINILKYLVKTQQRVLRLNVLAKWCQQVPLIQYSQQLASTLSSHDTCFTQTADSLFFMHEGLQQARAPIYDVPAAIEILLTGSYQRLPKCVEDVGVQSTLTEDQQKPALKKLDTIVRSKLLEVSVPKEISEVKVIDGTALLRVDGEFKVLVTLGYRGHLSMWRILHIELLVGERSGPVKLEEVRRHILGDDLERRMAATDNPFGTLYTVLHELCVVLVMDTVIRQVQTLRQGRWKDAIRFELISDGHSGPGGNAVSSQTSQDGEIDTTVLRTPGLKIFYWVDFDKNSGASDVGSCPFIKIEPGPDLQIKCLHSSFVVDPLRDREAELFLDQSCIDVEYLLLKAICCNRYTRLLEIYKDLGRNSHVCRAADDVFLCAQEDEPDTGSNKRDDKTKIKGKEVLCVRAYGSAYFTLGINIRNGRFLLRSSRNILASSTLFECEEALNNGSRTAADVFVSLKTKSILHLFACIGRFLGLQVYEQEFSSTRVPRNFLSGSTVLVMGFPECGSSYFLLMQLDEEFKPIFKLLETQQDLLGKAQPLVDLDHAIRVKTVDVGMMHILEDELNLSLLDSVNLLPLVGADQSPETGLLPEFSDRDSRFNSVLPSSFSSIVDELFELERGSSALNSVQSPNTMFNNSPASHNGYVARSLHGTRAGISPNWEVGSEINISTKVGNINPNYSNLPYLSSMGLSQSSSSSLQSSGPGKGLTVKKLSTSKSNQDISSLRSPYSAELGLYTTTDEDQLVSGNQLAQLSRQPVLQVSTAGAKANAPTNSLPRGSAAESLYVSRSRSLITAPVSEGLDSAVASTSTLYIGPRQEKGSGKRTLSDMLNLVPSLRFSEVNERSSKRRKLTESSHIQQPSSQMVRKAISRTDGYDYAKLIAEANNGNATSNIYVSTLLHVVSHCSLCIKHARLTSQMEALDIPYVEEVGLRNVSSNLWFRLPFSRGDTWKHICLRLGRPGCMYWDVKINDQHFRDLWELQKGSNSTSWGSGVRIANTSDMDSHIRYDAEGVILSYNSVEADSIKKLVADIHRLSNARMFALGMRDLLGVSSEENVEDGARFHDDKVVSGVKSDGEFDKSTEQMRRTFTIEAVGLMSLWFSFGSAVLARFVVEWESGKEGCTMHVSPDQLWPHTKFLEDFINGAEVAPLLDCIRLTAGPLHALAAATRPARAAPVSGVPGITSSNTTVPKNNGYIPSKGPTTSASNTTQVPSGLGGNLGASTNTSTPSAQNLHSAAMLAAIAAAGRSGPGIVPSSLLPIDVSVVLRGPYWIRIIYRKNFAVDMRCFAGDQVWLQPATPPKGGPSAGGSLPCPQFRPFIMEHVAQELNGFDPNFTGVQQTVALGNTNNAGSVASPGPGSHMSANNGNKVGNPGSAIISRLGNQINGLGRVGNSLLTSSTSSVVGSGLPLRKSPGAVVPPHVRGELNTAIIGLGDDGGYGGGWVPLVALKKVLRGILKYLGVLWLFAQLPDLLKEILGSILKDNEGALLNLDQEQPALRFFVGGYVFAVSVHRVQLLLQVLSVKRFHHSQQQQQQNPATAQEELTQSEIGEICDYFSRRVASEPYDASRVASFITLLTLPISVLREFLKLIAWKKGLAQAQGGDVAPAQKSRIELCLENHSGLNIHGNPENSSSSKSNIHYDRPHNSVDFGLTVVLDSAHIPHLNAAGGAAWLPYCVSVRLRYSFGEKPNVSFLGMEGSHGGRACWHRIDDWDKCKQRVIRTVEMNGSSTGELNQGRLKIIADSVQRTLHVCLQGLKDGTAVSGSMVM